MDGLCMNHRTCAYCNKPIKDREFVQVRGQYYHSTDRFDPEDCFQQHIREKMEAARLEKENRGLYIHHR